MTLREIGKTLADTFFDYRFTVSNESFTDWPLWYLVASVLLGAILAFVSFLTVKWLLSILGDLFEFSIFDDLLGLLQKHLGAFVGTLAFALLFIVPVGLLAVWLEQN